MASLLGRSLAARSPWTPEEAGRYAAARDIAMLAAFDTNRRLLRVARRLQLGSGGLLSTTQALSNQRCISSTAAAGASAAKRNSTACPKGAQAAAKPSSSRAASGSAAVQTGRPGAARRPRRRSEAAVERRSEAWDQRRIRSKFFKILPIVGQWARRSSVARVAASVSATARGGAAQAQSGATPSSGFLAAATRTCGAQRSSRSGESCGSSGGPAQPPPPAAAAYAPAPYVRQWTDARGVVRQQMYGRCGECLGACVLDHREEGGRGWMCGDCYWGEGGGFDLFG